MAHAISLTDGTTTVDLYDMDGNGIFATAWDMATPGSGADAQPVGESMDLLIQSTTTAGVQTLVRGVEQLLRAADERQRMQVGPRVFLQVQLDTESGAWRSEVLGGRLELPAAADQWGRKALEGTLGITRAPYWEGAEAELSISASGQAAATGGRTIVNDPAAGNWVQAAAAQVAGNMPAPVRIQLTNTTGSSQNYRKLMVGVNAYSDPDNFVHFLQGEARLSGGTVGADATASGGSLLSFSAATSPTTFVWTLPQADMQRTKGRAFRLLARFDGTIGPLYVQPQIRSSGGVVLWKGDELALESLVYESWQDLGVVPLPPGGYGASYAAHQLALVFRGAAVVWLDVLQLTALDSYRQLETVSTGVATANNAALVHDGIEGLAYVLATTWTPLPTSFGGPIMLQPGVNNRLYILHQVNAGQTAGDGDAPIAATMSVRLYYRPRRLTI